MSFTDPQSVTINAVPVSLPRVQIGSSDCTYRSADSTVSLRISHQTAKDRVRRMVRLDQTIIAADPLTAENDYQKAGVYIVIDEPSVGFTDTQLDYLVDALIAWFSTANIAKVLGSET